MEAMGLGWHNPKGAGFAQDTMTNGIEGSWTPNPTQWDNSYLENLFNFEWEQTRSPSGSLQWRPTDPDAPKTPDAHVKGQLNNLMMMTSDIALKLDPEYHKICRKFLTDFDAFTQAFSKAWYKLTHRDMGPKHRYLGPEVTIEDSLLWQDPLPDRDYELVGEAEIAELKQLIMATGLSVSDLVFTAFSAAATYRDSDKRGGANGGRLALAPQKDWSVNRRAAPVIDQLRIVMSDFNGKQTSGKNISLADMIVLGGCAAIEKAARDAGVTASVSFTPGRVDATQNITDIEMFKWLKPIVDGFRNYIDDDFQKLSLGVAPEELFLDKANLMNLSAPEWTVLTGGLRVLNVNHDGSETGVFTDKIGVLTNDFFVNVTDTGLVWEKIDAAGMSFALKSRGTGKTKFTATRNDLIFGSNSQLRSIADAYAGCDGHQRFVRDFIKVWDKVMMLDRYDVRGHRRYATMAA
jgi:catalase-peroxidase